MTLKRKTLKTALHLTFFLHLLILSASWLLTSSADQITENTRKLTETFDVLLGGCTLLFVLVLVVAPFKLLFSKYSAAASEQLVVTILNLFRFPNTKKYWKHYAGVIYCLFFIIMVDIFMLKWSLDPQVISFFSLTLNIAKGAFDELKYWEIIIWFYFIVVALIVLFENVLQAIFLYFELQVLYFITFGATIFGLFIGQGIFGSLPEKLNVSHLANEEVWYTPIFCSLGILIILSSKAIDGHYRKYLINKKDKSIGIVNLDEQR